MQGGEEEEEEEEEEISLSRNTMERLRRFTWCLGKISNTIIRRNLGIPSARPRA